MWHCLGAHGIEYSIAVDAAAGVGAGDSRAIVPFAGTGGRPVPAVPTMARPSGRRRRLRRRRQCDFDDDADRDDGAVVRVLSLDNNVAASVVENGAFDMVKMGKYDDFLRYLDVSKRGFFLFASFDPFFPRRPVRLLTE
jgi:hypothetical protein